MIALMRKKINEEEGLQFRKKEIQSLGPEDRLLLEPSTRRPWCGRDVGGED